MKYLLLLFLLFTIASCLSNTKDTDNQSTELAKKMAVAHEALKNSDLVNGLTVTSDILHHLPVEATQNDSTTYYIQKAFSYYCNLILMSRDFPTGIEFLNRLAASPTPFLQQHALPELTAMRSHFYLMIGQMERAEELADSFCLLPPIADKERFMKYNEMVASTYYYTQKAQKAIHLMEQAVEASRQGGNSKNMGRMLAWLSIFYHMDGNYEDAVRLNQEALEFYEHNPEDRSTMVAFNEQATLYNELGMHEKALEMNQKSIVYALRNEKYNLPDAYLCRANILRDLGRSDSIFYYLHLALATSREMKKISDIYGSNMELLNAYRLCPDSLTKVKPLIHELCADSANISLWMRAKLCMYIGKARMTIGQTDQAIEAAKRAVSYFETLNMTVLELDARTLLMDIYRQTGQQQQLTAGYARYIELKDTLHQQEIVRMVAAANIGYDTRQKEKENQSLTTEIELKNSRLQTFIFIGLFLLVAGLSIGGWLWMRLRLKEREKQLSQQQLREQSERLQLLIASRQELNNHNEKLLRQLADVQMTHDKTCDLDRVMESLQPRLLTYEEEELFRTAFASLYPTVLHSLRSICPRATRADELLCMLIVLKQTNEEISRTLGITRASVLKNRYRLRTKLELPEGSDLDVEIRTLLLSK